ncbi:MAG: hypothetical protein ACOYNV_21975 [Propionivibrio sp.]
MASPPQSGRFPFLTWPEKYKSSAQRTQFLVLTWRFAFGLTNCLSHVFDFRVLTLLFYQKPLDAAELRRQRPIVTTKRALAETV